MRVFKNTLVFIMGMIVGIILFVVAIGGAAYAIATSVSVGQLEEQLGIDIIDKNSEIGGKSILDVVQMIIGDVQNIDKLTINDLKTRYGLPIPDSVSGVDITSVFDYPLLQVPDHLGDLVNSVTLKEIGALVQVDFGSYGIPILTDNLGGSVKDALDAVLSSINSDTMSLRKIEDSFGITLGSNEILDTMKDAPLSSFGGLMNSLTVGDLVNIKLDLFLKDGDNDVWVNVDRYEVVPEAEFANVKDGAERYIEGADESGNIVYKELRFVKKTVTDSAGVTTEKYVVDNYSNNPKKDESGNIVIPEISAPTTENPDAKAPQTYYRHVVRERYDTQKTYGADTTYCAPAYINEISFDEATGVATVKTDGFINLSELFYLDGDVEKTADTLVNGAVFAPRAGLYYKDADGVSHNVEAYGFNGEKLPTAKSTLEAGYSGYIRVARGQTAAIQALAGLTLSSIDTAMDKVMGLKLGDILTIDETSPAILVSMKDKTLGDLQNTIDDVSLGDIVSVKTAAYVPDDNGAYVYVRTPDKERYVLYDASKHAGLQRYAVSGYTENASGKYVKYPNAADGNYYMYDASDARFEGCTRYDRNYAEANDGIYVKVASGGYFTLYSPDYPADAQRYSLYAAATGADTFVLASDAQILAKTGLYYYDTVAKTMNAVESGAPLQNFYYVKGTADAKALQRLASVSVKNFASSFNGLILGDVLDIDADVYAVTTDASPRAGKDYFTYADGLYTLFDGTAFAADGTKYYEITSIGSGNAVLKKLALIGVNDLGAKMDAIIDSLYLSDIIDIPVTAYYEDENGGYVYFPNGGYYTLYNPGDPAQSGLTRYSKAVPASGDTNTYVMATAKDIADSSVQKYYYTEPTSSAAGIFTAYVDGNHGQLYVIGTPASKVLQRFAKVSVGKFSSAFSGLILGDVLDIEADVYAITTDATRVDGKDYFTYADGVYSLFEGALQSGTQYYEIAASGAGHVVLKKLAFVKIDDMAVQMPKVIESVYLSELISVYTGSTVKPYANGDTGETRYIVAPRDELTEIDADGTVHRYTYVYDNDGKYYKTDAKYVKVDKADLVKDTVATKYDYTAITSYTQYAALLKTATENPTAENVSALYLYYKNSQNEYVYDVAVTQYLISKSAFTIPSTEGSGAMTPVTIDNLFYKKPATGGANTITASYKTGAASSDATKPLYVSLLGQYISYDPAIPAHADLDIYFKQTNGYAIIDSKNTDVTDKYYFDFTTGKYTTTEAQVNTGKLKFCLLTGSNSAYYFSELTSSAISTQKYSKKECETIYVLDTNGEYVYQDGSFKKITNGQAVSGDRYSAKIGYLATESEAGSDANALSTDKVSIIHEKSVPVLLAFANKKATVSNLGDKMREFTLGDLIEIAPDSMFDDPDLRAATMSTVSTAITNKLFNMTFSDLIKWGGITGVNAQVAEMLSNVKMADIVKGLAVDATGRIYLDIEKIYGLS